VPAKLSIQHHAGFGVEVASQILCGAFAISGISAAAQALSRDEYTFRIGSRGVPH
jgi:hypothetical protein